MPSKYHMEAKLPDDLQLMELTLEKTIELWKRMNEINGLFDDFKKNNFNAFRATIGSPNSLWLELKSGGGVVYLLDIVRGLSATAHFVFWDRKLRGKEELCRQALRFAMRNIPLAKVNVFLPDYAKKLGDFIRRTGFTREGKIRRWSMSNKRLFDVYVYGITYEEVMDNGRLFHASDSRTAGERVHRPSSELPERAPDSTDRGTDEPASAGVSSDTAIDQPDAAVDSPIRPSDREIPDGSNGRSGPSEHRGFVEPVPAEASD